MDDAVKIGVLAAAQLDNKWLATSRPLTIRSGCSQGIQFAPQDRFTSNWKQYAERAVRLAGRTAGIAGLKVTIEAGWKTDAKLDGGSASLSVALACWCLLTKQPHPAHVFCSGYVTDDHGSIGPGRVDALQSKAEYLDWIWKKEYRYVLIGGSNVRRITADRGERFSVSSFDQAVDILTQLRQEV